MGDFELRPPHVGDSLPRRADPHLVPPEELRLDRPGATPTGPISTGPAVDLATLMRAVGHYADEEPPSRAMPPRATPGRRDPIVRFDGEGTAGGTTAAPTGEVTGSAEVGSERARARVEGGLEGHRDAGGTSHASGSVEGSVHLERDEAALEAHARARDLGTSEASGSGDASLRLGGDEASLLLDGGLDGAGTPETSGHAGARVRFGSERGPHAEVGATATDIGTDAPSITTTTALSGGEHQPQVELEAGGTRGPDPTAHVGGAFSVSPREGTSVRVGGTAELGGAHPTGEVSAEVRARIAEQLSVHASGGITDIGGTPAGRVSGGLDAEILPGTHLTVDAGGRDLGTPDAAFEGTAGLRLDF